MKPTYAIDGYNLLHAMGVLLGKVAPKRLEKARDDLLSDLADTFGGDASQVTVVFDAGSAPAHVQAVQEFRGIKVLFAVGGREADDLIEELIFAHSHPRDLVIVSDDHRLERAARRRHAQPMCCAEFLDVLETRRRPEPSAPAAAPEKDDQLSPADMQHWLKEFGHLQKELDRSDQPVKLVKLPPAVSPKDKNQPKKS